MLERVLEPEVMDTEQDALEYQDIDNTEVNALFADQVVALSPPEGTLLDLGTGPGDISILLAQRMPRFRIVAVDLAEQMLILARRNVARTALASRIQIERRDAKDTGFPGRSFDVVVSNSLAHHIPEPIELFREIARVARDGAAVFVKDLLRPRSVTELDHLVRQHAQGASAYQRELFRNSLHAALRVEEVVELCARAGLSSVDVRQTSDRHWVVERGVST